MSMYSEYQGMRWYKCDLHVHTPEDARHWTDASFRLSSPRSEEDLQEKAREFLQHCHGLELDCIAVTDHNFSAETDTRKWFLTHLIEQNGTVAEKVGRKPLVIFPGFELDIRYHILCLFDPVKKGRKLQAIGDILTSMGLAPNARFANGVPLQPSHHGQCWSLREVLDKVQKDCGGIVVAAHAFSNDGICNDTANIADFVNNADLSAVEVNAWPPHEKARRILEGSNADWKRSEPHRQPAPTCGSDGKALTSSADANNLGCRFVWIKMSAPSCESLRQAFLDPESRMCLAPDPPEVAHAHVRTIRMMGNKFLQDQTLAFSPHLNCLIGGRGSGKSLLFESLRLGLRGEMPFKDADAENHVAIRQIDRLRKTFTNSGKIELDVAHDGLRDLFVVDSSGQPARIEGREVDDPPTVFRRLYAVIFSQEEITQLADRQRSLVEFIDSLAANRLEPHRVKALEIIDRLQAARQMDASIQRIETDLSTLKQEVVELGRQLEARAQVQGELRRHRAAQEAQRYLDSLMDKAKGTEEQLQLLAEELELEPPPLGSRVDTFPEKAFFVQAEDEAGSAYRVLAAALRTAGERFQKRMKSALSEHPDWTKVQEAIHEAEESFLAACNAKGLTPQEAERLREAAQQHRGRQTALQAKQAELENVRKQRPDVVRLLQDLTTCWRRETDERRAFLDEVLSSDTMPRTQKGEPILKASLTFAGDRETFLRHWGELAPDRRTAVGRSWDRYARDEGSNNIGDQLFSAFQEEDGKQDSPGNPVQWLELHLDCPESLPAFVRQYLTEIEKVREEKGSKWFDLIISRIPDAADLTLLRSDGSEAGTFEKRDLSTGQKNTAILSLLLSRGYGPVLIDQPEDELDSEFLFRELVPMFRNAKGHRQLIIVTHNANLPVNGDAELVYALEARGGQGVCRAQGGLDRPNVTRAVLDIMEGSEEAFLRRKEKYHF